MMAILKAIRRFQKNQNGTAMVEMGLVLPIFVIVLLGIAEFGWLINAYVTVQHATREGARLGITGAADADIVERIREAAGALNPSLLDIGIMPEASLRTRGQPLTVTVRYTHSFMTPLMSSIAGSTVTVGSSIDMRLE